MVTEYSWQLKGIRGLEAAGAAKNENVILPKTFYNSGIRSVGTLGNKTKAIASANNWSSGVRVGETFRPVV